MIRRFAALAISTSLVVAALALPAPAAAVDSAPVPSSMAAVGDSITQAASTGGILGADAPQNSWSTGTSSTVNSHFLRLRQLNPSVVAYNRSVSGAKVADLNAQMVTVAALDPDPGYLTVLIGGNDLCTDTVAQMTSVADFRSRFDMAMQTITTQSPGTSVYVVSIPDVWQLWNLFKNNFWARFVWNSAKICQSLLANPTSTQQADVQRRAAVRQRNIDYNTQLAQVCALYASRCHFDGNAVFNVQFTTSDVSGDYFHPSVAGQAKLSSVSWGAGYSWVSTPPPNQAPVASFSYDCAALTCSFDASASSDDAGIASYAWDFGDGTLGSGVTVGHAYSADGEYAVTLTVTDGEGLTDTQQRTVSVAEAPVTLSIRVAALAGEGTSVNRNFWRANVTATVTDTDGTATSGATVTGTFSTGRTKSCTTGSAGTCTLASDNLRTNVSSVTFNVSGVTHASLAYDPNANLASSVSVARPT